MFWTKTTAKQKNSSQIEKPQVESTTQKINKEFYKQQKAKIDSFHKVLYDRYKAIADAEMTQQNEKSILNNTICPKCAANIVVNKYIKKRDDIFEYCHCNGCGHEWPREEVVDLKDVDVGWRFRSVAHFLDRIVLSLLNATFDPNDLTCEADTPEEWEQEKIETIKKRFGWIIEDMPLEMIFYYGYTNNTILYMTEEIFGKDSYSFNSLSAEPYICKFNEAIEDILINKFNIKRLCEFN